MGLSGDLTAFGVAELLQILSMGKKSGVLHLRGEATRGSLTLLQGRVVDAEVEDGAVGEEAFFALLDVHQGRFTFRQDFDGEGRQSIRRTLDALLLDASGRRAPWRGV
jgi:hypothetical protein